MVDVGVPSALSPLANPAGHASASVTGVSDIRELGVIIPKI